MATRKAKDETEEVEAADPDGRRAAARRKNLGPFIRARLSPEGVTRPVTTKLPPELVAQMDALRGSQPRSTFIREALEAKILAMQNEG